MKTQSKLNDGIKGKVIAGLALGSILGFFALSNLSKDKTLETKLKDGRNVVLSNSPWGIPGLYVYNADGSLNAFYSEKDSSLEYRDPKGATYKITDKGYSTLNHRKGNYENFVSHSKDSSLYFKAKEYDEIIRIMNQGDKR